MSVTDPGTEIATEFATELAKQIPIKDALAAPARQTGQILEDIVKTIQLALVPFQVAGALQDRLRGFIDRSVRKVPAADRVSPAPQILGPIIEGIRYEPEGTPIDEMFANLLASSMNSARVGEAHPAFPTIIRQLSSDEARILARLKGQPYDHEHTRDYDRATNLFHGGNTEIDALPRDQLVFPNNVAFYMQHLNNLGLAGVFQVGNQEVLSSGGQQTGVRIRSQYRLTEFGASFVRACT
jgi:hypothetical protein